MIFLLALLTLQGCSTYGSKSTGRNYFNGQPNPNQIGHPYSGVTLWAGATCTTAKNTIDKVKKGPAIGSVGIVAMASMLTVLLAFDFVFTVTADTIMLPADLILSPNRSRITVKEYC